jgi:hypothetical protein
MKTSFHLIFLCILTGFFFTVLAQKVKESKPTIDSYTYRYIAPKINPGVLLDVYPHFADYWTGTCDSSSKTHISEVLAGGYELGWMMFDISEIPLDATINSITFYGYVSNNNFPHWSITPMDSINPLTNVAADIYNQVSNNYQQGVAYSYNDESGTLPDGWLNRVLNSNAINDLQNAIQRGWFAIGIVDWDYNPNNYIDFRGWWNYSLYPYLVVDCTLTSILHDVGTASIGVSSFVPDGLVIPKATVYNRSTSSETFNVTMTITPGGYSSTKTVTDLPPGFSTQVIFNNWNATPGDYTIEVCTALATDPNPENNCKSKIVRCQHVFTVVLYEQMANAGTNSITSQNYEAVFDSFDCQGADDFIIPGSSTDYWIIATVEVLGTYYNGIGQANSVNVWFYNDSSGHPGSVAASVIDIVPNAGIETGAFLITLQPTFITLVAGHYWLSVQCNMDFYSGGQWGWTEQLQFNLESNWQNPGGGFLTPFLNWGNRVTECQIGNDPYYDFSFSLGGVLIPVELTSFTASAGDGFVELKWITATETNNQGFSIERSSGGEYEAIGFVQGHGTTTEIHHYTFTDNDVKPGKYQYKLKQTDYDGTFEYSQIVEIEIPFLNEFSLSQNYPNPFNPSTFIKYSVPGVETYRDASLPVTLKVYDILGNEVATLVNEEKPAGTYEVEFNSHSGLSGIKELPSGIYFYQLKAGEFAETKKMILMK